MAALKRFATLGFPRVVAKRFAILGSPVVLTLVLAGCGSAAPAAAPSGAAAGATVDEALLPHVAAGHSTRHGHDAPHSAGHGATHSAADDATHSAGTSKHASAPDAVTAGARHSATAAAAGPLHQAASASRAQPGFKAVLQSNVTVPGASQPMHSNLVVTYSVPERAASVDVTLPLPLGPGGADENVPVDALDAGGTIYLQLPAVVAARLPLHRQWLSFNSAALKGSLNTPYVASLVNFSGLGAPGDWLSVVAGAPSSVALLGTPDVDGSRTTEYQADFTLAGIAGSIPPGLRPYVEANVARDPNLPVPLDVWVGSDHLVRRIAMSYAGSDDGRQIRDSFTEDFLSYGTQAMPAIPAPADTLNLTTLLGGAA